MGRCGWMIDRKYNSVIIAPAHNHLKTCLKKGKKVKNKKECEAPWNCKNLKASESKEARGSRAVDGHELCRPCYQYVWEQCRGKNKNGRMSFKGLPGPMRPVERIPAVCNRKGCLRILQPNMGQAYRSIGNIRMCRPCYQATWALAKRREISLELAWQELPPK
jgi:hypothetical protein